MSITEEGEQKLAAIHQNPAVPHPPTSFRRRRANFKSFGGLKVFDKMRPKRFSAAWPSDLAAIRPRLTRLGCSVFLDSTTRSTSRTSPKSCRPEQCPNRSITCRISGLDPFHRHLEHQLTRLFLLRLLWVLNPQIHSPNGIGPTRSAISDAATIRTRLFVKSPRTGQRIASTRTTRRN
jgi:hypothetical protein